MKYLILFICFLSLIFPLHAEITPIPQRDYFTTVQELLAGAEKSIDIEMYLIYSDSSQVRELLEEIIEAQNRGIEVNILLEDGHEDNKTTLEYLKNGGVIAKLDAPETKLHAKSILVDDKMLVIGSSNWTKKAFNENNESNVLVDLVEDKARIEVLRDGYADRLLKVIDEAREQIDIIIYAFQFGYDEEDKNYEIMSSLLRAYDRGCRIRIILDSWKEESRNESAYHILEQAGVKVYYDLDIVPSHNKLVIIDNEIVILGSANWTEAGLTKNRESSILIRDPPTSRIYKGYIDELLDGLPEKETIIKVPIPISFFKDDGLLRRLHYKGITEGIRLYCWLIWEAFNKGTYILEKDYKGWYEALYGNSLPWNTTKRKRIYQNFCRLEKEGALRLEKMGKEIILIKESGLSPIDNIFVPREFWTYEWIKKLSASGLYLYLVNLCEFKESSFKPGWTNSIPNLMWEYGIGRTTLIRCSKELMHYNLIEIRHDIPAPEQAFYERKANRYFINPLWKEEELELKWEKLAERHCRLFSKARDLAAEINEPYDPRAVTDLIRFMKIYGPEAVTEAVDIATKLSFENGKWELHYIAGILRNHYVPLERP